MFVVCNGSFHRVSNEPRFYDRTVVFHLVVRDFVSVQSLVIKALLSSDTMSCESNSRS